MTRVEVAELYSLVARDPLTNLKERLHAATELSRLFGYSKLSGNDTEGDASNVGSEEHNRRLAVAAQIAARGSSNIGTHEHERSEGGRERESVFFP